MKILTLPLKQKWYDMIASNEKKEEYREIKWHWAHRILYAPGPDHVFYEPCNITELIEFGDLAFRNIDAVQFTLGYPKKGDSSRRMTFKCEGISVGKGKQEWGAEPDKDYFVIKIGERL